MPRLFEYTQKRFMLMQLCMCGVLALTIGAAALVDHSRSHVGNVVLDRTVSLGNVAVRLPGSWDLAEDENQSIAEAVEPTREDLRRTITVRRRETGWLEGFFATGDPKAISFGELGTGVLYVPRHNPVAPRKGERGEIASHSTLLARVELRGTDQILEIAVDRANGPDTSAAADADVALIKRIAATARRINDDDVNEP